MDTIRILIADDHPVVRAGLSATLRTESDVQIVGEAENGVEVVRRAKELQPHIILMDLKMPELDGVEAMRRIIADNPDIKVIVLTTYDTDEYIFRGIEAGARAYLLKDCSAEELLKAIRTVHRGGSLLEPAIAGKLISRFVELSRQVRDPDSLTRRETEVLKLVALGVSNRNIAAQLSISDNTVKAHVSNIFGKLQVNNRAEATAEAVRKGIIEL